MVIVRYNHRSIFIVSEKRRHSRNRGLAKKEAKRIINAGTRKR